MNKQPKIAHLGVEKLNPGRDYDAVVTTLGYEKRARHVAERFAPRSGQKYALGFKEQQVLSYSENREWYKAAGYVVEDLTDAEFIDRFKEICARLDSTARAISRKGDSCCVTMLLDISSLTRSRLAAVIDHLWSQTRCCAFSVDFYYTLAQYDPPPQEVLLNSHVGPVTPAFAGWTNDPDRGVAAVVGLGYEEDKALGAVEHVQAVEIWTYIPCSPISQYSTALAKANRTLLEAVSKDHQLSYTVSNPLNLYTELESLIYRLCQHRNVILFPFGPKIFALCSILAACSHPQAAVWRVSAEGLEDATDRLPSDFVFGLAVSFPPSPADPNRLDN
jgi:hypothetical protein